VPAAPRAPIVVVGAFDRHNVGDLLFARVADALLAGETLVFAGLAERDLRADGGVQVIARSRLAEVLAGRPARVLHAGGELLTCSAWQAAVMLQPAGGAPATLGWLDAAPDARAAVDAATDEPRDARAGERRDWVRRVLGCDDAAPYLLSRAALRGVAVERIGGVGLGGVDLDAVEPALRAEAIAKLVDADDVVVRDARTQALVQAAGVAAQLAPDPVQLVAELFGDEIVRHAARGEVATLRRALPRGHLAVQFSADFGDDATLDALAAALGRVAAARRLGIALFRAGAAPWHDDLGVYRRFVARLRQHGAMPVALLESLHVFDICALIATARGYVGSSLHGRILAMAHGVPRLNLHRAADAARVDKQRAYAATWEPLGLPSSVRAGDVEALAGELDKALDADADMLAATARRLADGARVGYASAAWALD
jgi:hypothetical protein